MASRWHGDRFDDSEHLASLNLPIEPGDIFEAADPRALIAGKPTTGKRCILLTQHCDTIVRSDGHRLGNPKTLTVALLKRIPQGKDTPSDFRLEWFEEPDPGGYWYARLGYRAQVPVKALEACALGADGAAVIRLGAAAPARLTPG